MGGAERVVLALHEAFPDAPIYTSVCNRSLDAFAGMDVRTSYLQRVPLARKHHQLFPTLRRRAFESFNFSDYDVVVSSSSAEAKGIITGPTTLHLCYCHTPTRYYWSDAAFYLQQPGFRLLNPIIRLVGPSQISKMRVWDYVAAQRVDRFIANSQVVADRIRKFYRRDSSVVNPPVDVTPGPPATERSGFLALGRQVPYKRLDLAVAACSELSLPLTVVGRGPEHRRLRKLAGPTVTFVTDATDAEVAACYRQARALIHPSNEDFGLIMAEALSCGCPVIAYRGGGAREIVTDGRSGVFFDEQTVSSLIATLERFQGLHFEGDEIARDAERYRKDRFVARIRAEVDRAVAEWRQRDCPPERIDR